VIDAAELTQRARAWVGVPYRHQGRDRRYGVDCIGFIIALLDEAGALPAHFVDVADYGRSPQRLLQGTVAKYAVLHTAQLQEGCLLLLRWELGQAVSHAAYFTDKGTIIHCYGNVGRVVENGYRGPWPRLTDTVWQLPSVRYE
jgi:cell wall-associated NlpC family hydrolase